MLCKKYTFRVCVKNGEGLVRDKGEKGDGYGRVKGDEEQEG